MNNYLKLALATLLVTSTSAFSAFPQDGWYFGFMGLGSYQPSQSITLSNSQLNMLNANIASYRANDSLFPKPPYVPVADISSPNGKVKYSFGGGIAGQLGYRWCGFRLEGELLINYNNYDKITIGGVAFNKRQYQNTAFGTGTFPYSMSGHSALGGALFNVFYDLYGHEKDEVTWIPYVGLGIGYAYIQNQAVINLNTFNTTTQTSTFAAAVRIRDSESAPIGQAIIGLSYLLDDNFSVGADYRYLTSKQISNFDNRITIHTINFNFNYWFSAD